MLSKQIINSIILISFLLVSYGSSGQKSFDIDKIQTKELIPIDYLNVYVDDQSNLTIQDILQPSYQSQFKACDQKNINVQNFEEAYWVKFKLTGKSLSTDNWILEAPDCNISYIDLYYVHDGQLVKQMESGSLQPHINRKYKHKNFVLELPKVDDEIEFYARMKSSLHSQFLFNVHRSKYFTEYALSEYILLGLFYGILFIMGIYSFLLYIVNRSKINLWYFIYAISCMLVCTVEDGLGFQYVWPNFPKFNFFLLHHAPNLLLISFLVYSNYFLELNKRQPTFFKLILFISIASILFSLSGSSFLSDTFAGTYGIPFVLIYIANIIGVKQGFAPAKYFLCAFSFSILGILALCFRRFGVIDWSSLGKLQVILLVYAFNIALLIEIVLLSVAQALKVKFVQMRQQAILTAKENTLRNIFNSSFDALLVYNPATQIITDTNIKATELFQFNKSQLASSDITDLISIPAGFPDDKIKTIKDLVLNVQKTKLYGSFEADSCDASGKLIRCEVTLSPLDDRGQFSYVFAVKDISQRKETEKSLDLKMIEISEKNEKLETYISSNSELENFAYVASHDMKQPIRSIKSFTQMLQKHLDKKNLLDERTEEYLNFVIGGADNLNNLVEDLLEHSKISSLKEVTFRLYDVEDILLNVNLNLNQQITENKVIINSQNLPTINIERVRMIQLLQNLFSNAIKFRKKDIDCVIEFDAKENEDHWLFTVKDNGIGMEEKYQDEVFQIFRKLHSSHDYSGNGIGLATCKKIVEQHGGRIWVESELGVGTTFFFTIKKDLNTFNMMLVTDKEKVLN